MDTVTLPKKEYEKLVEAARPSLSKFWLPAGTGNGRKNRFTDKAFGLLKKSFGKKSSISYVSKMRKAWRA